MGFGHEFNGALLARKTSEVLQSMMSWCQIINAPESLTLKEVQSQMVDFAKAISFSVETARQGLAFSGDVLKMVECIQNTTKKKRGQILEGVKVITLKGSTNAKEARNGLRCVGLNLYALLDRMKTEDLETKLKHDRVVCNLFLSDLKGLYKILAEILLWWGGIEKAMPIHSFREDEMAERKFDELDLEFVERSRKDLRNLYTTYVNEFDIVLGRYLDLFVESEHHPSSEAQHSITNEDIDDSSSFTTIYSNAPSSTVTDYGLLYTRHAFNSSNSVWGQN